MRVSILLVCLISAATCSVINPASEEPIIDLNAISKMTAQELDQLAGGLAAEELIRTKRSGLSSLGSGSGSILGQVSKSISSGLSSKLALVGQASAGASALFGGGSSKGNSDHGYSYGPPAMTYKTPSFDFFSLKKSILNTLFQAVKAITGGVTILKGQIIKGGGALVSGVGRIVSVKGDAVTNLGRHIVNSASLVPPKKSAAVVHHAPIPVVHHAIPSGPPHPVSSYGPPSSSSHFSSPSGPPADHYGPPTVTAGHYDAPSPTTFYGPPSTHNSIYGVPSKYSHPFEGRGKGLQAGFILLQPLEGANGPPSYDTHTAPTGPPSSFVSGAIQAIKGFIGGNTFKSPPSAPEPTSVSAPESHDAIAPPSASSATGPESLPPSAPTAPSDNYQNSIYHPPPHLPPSEHSYNSYSNQNAVPPFKPLDHSGEVERPSTHYGEPITSEEKLPGPINLQTMVDAPVDSQYDSYGQPYVGPSYDSYLASFPNAQSPHSSKEPNSANYARHLSPLQLNKIVSNVDKINVHHRSDDQAVMNVPFDLYTEMAIMQIAMQNINKTISETARSNSEDHVEAIPSAENSQEDFESTKTNVKHRVDVDRSISYELRGNRIVRLTDSTTDKH